MISGPQCRAARALLGLSQSALSDQSGVAQATIVSFETGKRSTYMHSVIELEMTLEALGVEFGDYRRSAVMLKPDYVAASAPRAHRRLSPLRVVRGTKKAVRLEGRYDDKKVIVLVDNNSIDDYFCANFTNKLRTAFIDMNLPYVYNIVEYKIDKCEIIMSKDAIKSVITVEIGESELRKYNLNGLRKGQAPYAGLPKNEYANVISYSMSREELEILSANDVDSEKDGS
ncbi:MAG: helix-turn-helix transcriptional regulator [Roseiarcus sp.]|jgi:transcriptional regulator with XRE-family HTH domain